MLAKEEGLRAGMEHDWVRRAEQRRCRQQGWVGAPSYYIPADSRALAKGNWPNAVGML